MNVGKWESHISGLVSLSLRLLDKGFVYRLSDGQSLL